MFTISKISTKDAIPVRYPVLMEGKPIEGCFYDGDELESTVHFGCFLDEELVGVVTLLSKKNSLFAEDIQAQMRGMAVLKKCQKQGLGDKLFNECVKYCEAHLIPIVWFNARVGAMGFYEKMGCEKIGTVFEVKNAGEHYVMYKRIFN